jgi:hypothetical protein
MMKTVVKLLCVAILASASLAAGYCNKGKCITTKKKSEGWRTERGERLRLRFPGLMTQEEGFNRDKIQKGLGKKIIS